MDKLKFSRTNRKLWALAKKEGLQKNQVLSFDLPCGHTCPAANKCKAFVDIDTRKLCHGPHAEFVCYGALIEMIHPNVMNNHLNNFNILKSMRTSVRMADRILEDMPSNGMILRVHAFGDFYNETYFKAWLKVAEAKPNMAFFAYTKMLPFLSIPRPSNFDMVYSYGGIYDKRLHGEPTCYVVNGPIEADKLGIKLACVNSPADDFDAIKSGQSFGLTLHGHQPKWARGTMPDYTT